MHEKKTYTLFVVDPAADCLANFQAFFAGWSHLFYFFDSRQAALETMSIVTPDLVLARVAADDPAAKGLVVQVLQRCPNAIRIVFGRREDFAALTKLVANGVAHRLFTLPWEEQHLREMVSSDIELRSRLQLSKSWDYLQLGSRLTVLPAVAFDVGRLLQDPECSIDLLVATLQKDPVISSRLLQVVNSSAFPKARTIHDLHHAVSFLGLANMREIVLFMCTVELFPPAKGCYSYFLKIARHSYLCSKLAGAIAREILPEAEREAATIGLLHDIGKLVFFASDCARYLSMGEGLGDRCLAAADELEKEYLGISHGALGSSLLLWWNLPISFVEAVASHDLPIDQLAGITRVVAIADRCLVESQSNGVIGTDIGRLEQKMPIADWRKLAAQLLSE